MKIKGVAEIFVALWTLQIPGSIDGPLIVAPMPSMEVCKLIIAGNIRMYGPWASHQACVVLKRSPDDPIDPDNPDNPNEPGKDGNKKGRVTQGEGNL